MLRPIFASSTFNLDECPDRLEPGLYRIGRSSLLRQDMRVSRTQIELIVMDDRVSVAQVCRFFFVAEFFTNFCIPMLTSD